MKPERIRMLLEQYLKPLPDRIEYKVQKYMVLLDMWGARMPLTSLRDKESIVRFHFGESIFALSDGNIRKGRLADVGSGAGFPGLAIKLANPALSISLVESNKKKSAFLHEVVRSLELSGVEILCSDFKHSEIRPNSLSFATCRALGRHGRILQWASEKLVADGLVLLWLGEDDCRNAQSACGWSWMAPRLIPGTQGRFLLRGEKVD